MSSNIEHCKRLKCMKEWPGVIQSGMFDLWKQQELCDVIIIAKDGSIKCHKVALAAHSSLMARIISEYAPEDLLRIKLPAYTMTTVRSILNFMYMSDTELCPDNIGQVISLSIKMGLMAILDACKTYLVKYARNDNVILHYSIALNNGLQDTAQLLLSNIIDHFCEVSKTTHFLYMNADRIVPILQCNKLNVCCEMDVFRAVVSWVNFDRISRVPQAKRLMDAIHFEDIYADELIEETERSHWLLSECSPVRDIIFEVIRYQCIRSKNNLCPLPCYPICNTCEPLECDSNRLCSCVHNCLSDSQCESAMFGSNFCGNNMNFMCCPLPNHCGTCSDDSKISDEYFHSSLSYLKAKVLKEPETFLNRQYDQFKEINGTQEPKSASKSSGSSRKRKKKKNRRSYPMELGPKLTKKDKSHSSKVSWREKPAEKQAVYASKSVSDHSYFTGESDKSLPSDISIRTSSSLNTEETSEKKSKTKKPRQKSRMRYKNEFDSSSSKSYKDKSEGSSARRKKSKMRQSLTPSTVSEESVVRRHRREKKPRSHKRKIHKFHSEEIKRDYTKPPRRERIYERYRERDRNKRGFHSNMNNMSSPDNIKIMTNKGGYSSTSESKGKTNSYQEIASMSPVFSSRSATPSFVTDKSFTKVNNSHNNDISEIYKKLHSSKHSVKKPSDDFMMYYNLSSQDAPYLLMIGGLDLHKVDSDVPGRFIMALSVSQNQRGRGSWIRVSMQLEQFLHHHQAAVIHGKLYLIGGAIFNPEKPNRLGVATDGVTIFNFRTGQWRLGPPMISPRAYFGMARWHDRLIVVGGENSDTSETDQIDYYDTSTDTWGILTHHPGGPRLGVSAAVLKNVLYVVGGYSESRNNRGEIMSDSYGYNLMTGQWSVLSYLNKPVSHATLVVLNSSTLILAGGRTIVNGQKGSSTNAVMAYYENRNVWKQVGQLSVGRHDMASTVVKTGSSQSCVYMVGGMSNPNPAALKIVECLTFDDKEERASVMKVTSCPYAVTGTASCLVK